MSNFFNFINKRGYVLIALALIAYSLYLSSTLIRHHDLGFNTDLARDFLLLEDLAQTHKLPLIGPRSGGIPGVFHGPLWIYLNLPAFVLGNGNPIIVGWFWIVLTMILIGIIFFVGKRLFDTSTGILSSLLVSLLLIRSAAQLFNPFGAVMLFPLFYFTLHSYLHKHKYSYLLASLFLAGLLIQFQIAFGGPILLLSLLLLLYSIYKRRAFKDLTAFAILLIPFSTYIIFDLRHNLLELRALLDYIQSSSPHIKGFTKEAFISNRLEGIASSLIPIPIPQEWRLLTYLTGALLAYQIHLALKNFKHLLFAKKVMLYFYLFFGYWLLTLFFHGVIWDYYVWPFMPVGILMLVITLKSLPKYIFAVLLLVFCYFSFINGYNYISTYLKQEVPDAGTWKFNQILAEKVYENGDKEFGYYIFSPDQFGYSQKYAMHYIGKQHSEVNAAPFTKKDITYLIISPPGGEGNGIGGDWWRQNRVKITTEPIKRLRFSNGFLLEKYRLSQSEQKVPSDPNLIDSLIFR